MFADPTFYRLCRDTFTRRIGDYGYISSQLTKHDRLYDKSGAAFLGSISREPLSFEEIVGLASAHFVNPPLDDLLTDLNAFLTELEQDHYIVSGESPRKLDIKEPRFSYSSANPKTTVYNFLQSTDDIKYPDTADFLHSILQNSPRVFSCQIELTNRCNERCLHCYIPHQAKNDLLETPLILDVLDQLHEMDTMGLSLSGGEALMHPDFFSIVRHARKLDFSITILSNLTLLTAEHIALFKDINPSFIQTSLYSMDADEHDTITKQPHSHKKTLAALEALIAADIPVQISCPVMRTNLHSYRHVVQWAQAHRCKAQTDFIMMAKTDFSTDNLNERLSLQETELLIRDILEVDIDYDALLSTPVDVPAPEKEAKKPICGVGLDNICLAGNGTYYPCSGWQGFPIGDARKERLADVWQNSPALKQLRAITKGSFPACITCADKEFCAMCLVRNFNESSGDMFLINRHFCDVAHINCELVEDHKRKLVKPER